MKRVRQEDTKYGTKVLEDYDTILRNIFQYISKLPKRREFRIPRVWNGKAHEPIREALFGHLSESPKGRHIIPRDYRVTIIWHREIGEVVWMSNSVESDSEKSDRKQLRGKTTLTTNIK